MTVGSTWKHFSQRSYVEKDELEEYKKEMGKHWSREIMEGATFPPTLKTKRNMKRRKCLQGHSEYRLTILLKMPCPAEDAETLTFETTDGENHRFRLDKQRISFSNSVTKENRSLKMDQYMSFSRTVRILIIRFATSMRLELTKERFQCVLNASYAMKSDNFQTMHHLQKN